MPKKDHLASLIHSLTPAEKKYFVQFTQLRTDDKSYMKLYNAVLKSGEYNAAKLATQLNKTKANLAHEKEYLIENILKALRNFHDKEPEIGLYNLIGSAVLLRNRKLYGQAYQYLKKADKQAELLAQFDIRWRLHTIEQSVVPNFLPNPLAEKAIAKSLREMEDDLSHISTAKRFLQFGFEQQRYLNQVPIATTKEHLENDTESLKHPLLNEKFKHPCFRFQQLYYTANIYFHMRKPAESLNCFRKALRIIETHPSAFAADITTYAQCVQGYILLLYYTWSNKEFLAFLDKLKSRYYHRLPFNSQLLDNRFDAFYYQYKFLHFLSEGQLKQPDIQHIETVLNNYEKQYELLQGEYDDSNWIATQRCVVELYFHVLHDNEKALNWAHRIQNNPRSNTSKAFLSLVKITLVLIHFQLQNYTLLPSLISSATRHLKKYGPYSVVEEEVFRFILHYPKLLNDKEKQHAFRQLNERLLYFKDTLPATETSLRRIFYFRWIDRNLY